MAFFPCNVTCACHRRGTDAPQSLDYGGYWFPQPGVRGAFRSKLYRVVELVECLFW